MITVLGSVNLDHVGRVPRLPGPGETVGGNRYDVGPGGKGANQALAARRGGADVRMYGAVGDDPFADAALVVLREDGIDLTGVATRTRAHTGCALILVDEEGENSIAVLPGANGQVSPVDAIAALSAMQTDDILVLQQEIPHVANLAALRGARERGFRTVLNIAPFVAETVAAADLASVLVANESEFSALCASTDFGAAMIARHGRLGQDIVVTLGGKGALVAHEGSIVEVAAPTITVVDTVGAGDTFCGYLAAGLGRGIPFVDAVRLAICAASLACTRSGAQPSIPFHSEVASLLSR